MQYVTPHLNVTNDYKQQRISLCHEYNAKLKRKVRSPSKDVLPGVSYELTARKVAPDVITRAKREKLRPAHGKSVTATSEGLQQHSQHPRAD